MAVPRCNLLCGLGGAATLSALYTIQGDGVRHNRSSAHVLELMTPGSRAAPGVFLFRLGGG
jgi:hypothetical protein